jgi:glycerol uptake facilitator-like aquaporin
LKQSVSLHRETFFYPIGYTICAISLHQLFKEVSGGVFNPALAVAQIFWQNQSFFLEIGFNMPYWTPVYSVCYIFGPLIGAFLAGTIFNIL